MINDKMTAGLVTAVGVVPICAVCILGPAAVGSLVAGAFGWFWGLGPILTTALAMISGLLVYGLFRRRKSTGHVGRKRAYDGSPTVADRIDGAIPTTVSGSLRQVSAPNLHRRKLDRGDSQ